MPPLDGGSFAVKEPIYFVICGQAVGGDGQPITIGYSCDHQYFNTRAEAISHGFTKGRSDDFNIGVMQDGKLTSLDWMEKKVTTDPEKLAQIQSDLWL